MPPRAPFVELGVASCFSFLRGASDAVDLVLTAHAHGYDAQWLTEWVAYDEKLAPALGVKPGEKLAGFVYIGTRTMPKTDRDRPILGDVYSVMKG